MPQKLINPLWIAWWNTGLVPGKETGSCGTARLKSTSEIINQLIENDHVDLLALGEITPELVEQLYCHASALKSFKPVRPNSGDIVRIEILYNEERIEMIEHEIHTVTALGKAKKTGLYAKMRIVGHAGFFHVFAIHWPSRLFDQDGTFRGYCAGALRASLNAVQTGEPIIILGDFNDEPHDKSVYNILQSSRERNLVRKRPGLLYNPFWRHLGERQAMSSETDPALGAGSHYYGSGMLSRWYTLDQILVSAALLGSGEWVLVEEEVGIWQAPPLLTGKGKLVSGFDHFPVIAAIAQVIETDQGEDANGQL